MPWNSGILLLLLSLAGTASAADAASTPDPKAVPGADKANGKVKKKKKSAERLDLNQIDLEQVEEDWESTPTKPMVDVTNSVKIREIVEPTGEYSYASFGRPDPFLQPEISMDPVGDAARMLPLPMGKEIPIVSVLQRYPLSDLNVKGVWQLSSGETRAVIQTPKLEGVVVKEGDPISSGKVLSIRKDQLLVRLYRLRADGVREYEDVPMKFGGTEVADKAVIKLEPGKDPIFVNPDAGRPSPVVPLGQAMANPASPLPSVPVPPAGTAGAAAGTVPSPTGQGNPGVQPVKSPPNVR